MSDKQLTPRQAAERLGCPVETVCGMLRAKLILGNKVKGQWQIRAAEVDRFQTFNSPEFAPPPDPGVMQVTLALAAIAVGVATVLLVILPKVSSLQAKAQELVIFSLVLASIVAVLSTYSALWFLACYCLGCPASFTGLPEISKLLVSPIKRPYWLIAWGLVFWLILSVLIFVLAMIC